MKPRTLTCITAMIVFVALAIPLQLTAQQTRYTVTDLGTLGGNNSFAQGINNRGEVVGVAETPTQTPTATARSSMLFSGIKVFCTTSEPSGGVTAGRAWPGSTPKAKWSGLPKLRP